MIKDKDQTEKIRRLAQCKFAPASGEKRFIRQCDGSRLSETQYELTEKQAQWLDRIFYRYRKQLEKIL